METKKYVNSRESKQIQHNTREIERPFNNLSLGHLSIFREKSGNEPLEMKQSIDIALLVSEKVHMVIRVWPRRPKPDSRINKNRTAEFDHTAKN